MGLDIYFTRKKTNEIGYFRKVLENHDLAEELLPTCSGFFFGPTEYNARYFESVQDVLNFVENELLPEFNELNNNESIYFEIWY